MELIGEYINYIRAVKRFSPRTVDIYRSALDEFTAYLNGAELLPSLNNSLLRSYEVHLLSKRKLSPRTVRLHLSVLSGFCRYLMKQGLIQSNPLHSLAKPKMEKRLPVFYRKEALEAYFSSSRLWADEECLALVSAGRPEAYEHILRRLIISLLYHTGIRRSELIGLQCSNVDISRSVLKVKGKGDKMREIPLSAELIREILLYLQACSKMGFAQAPSGSLLLTKAGRSLYPAYVDKAVKQELSARSGISQRKSPHVLRHSIATELLNEGANLNSIKEMLGHSSLAATQVYTHNSIEKLKEAYTQAHPKCQASKK